MENKTTVDVSDIADAKRFRWLLSNSGYSLKKEIYPVSNELSEKEKDRARNFIDGCIDKGY